MDILMPDMRGDDATKILREMPEYEKLPIIALTASGFDGKRDELMELGFSEYLRKPFLENELYTMISTFIPVEYIYEEQHNETTFSSDNSSADEIAKYVRELPDNLQAELSEAIEFQEFEKIERIIKLLPDNSSNHKLRSSLERAVLFSNYKILTAITDCLQSNS